jgi:long-chain acyl-CoA synthetase
MAWRAAWAPTSWTASRWRSAIACSTAWAMCWSTARCERLGLSRIRVAYTAGAAIGPDLFRFFRSIGINLKQLYGQTETCAYVCLQPDGEVKLDTVGQAAPGVELKIADNGEVLVRSRSLLKEYYKRPDATAEVIDADGYFHTGDAGVIDADGHLRIIDRAKDVGKLTAAPCSRPTTSRTSSSSSRTSRKRCALAMARPGLRLHQHRLRGRGQLGRAPGLPYAGYTDLAGKPEVLAMMRECVEKVNADLAGEGMAATQIARFLVLHKELDPTTTS